ncbi:lytic transglycosylase domain-containing protein [Mechercharimyces sp. CAU 1602]|uniref:lytic transglycosylase domain-containing protein n=1 Tax=Mechercharimyces sp. CAU 1602 TaxID=2973933 RepID=UPI002162F2C2|nr:lytic transglycosylase domain-containing protein [Mechercharimyces sp. CAU 1602]MCS1351590.1 lytic transglycosylase domain-containing protein [Mechercharimyces sp. CAU 1602]
METTHAKRRRTKSVKRVFPSFRSIIFLFFIAAAAFFFFTPYYEEWRYPLAYEEEIFYSADVHDMDPYLVMAVIRVESRFDPNNESHKGAQGLMQLMPDTVKHIVESGGFSPSFNQEVNDPGINIRMGTWYLDWLEKEFNGNQVAMVAGYNAGPGSVKRWMREGTWDGSMEHVENIPFKETREYVEKVFFYYEKYEAVYKTLNLEPETRSPQE